MMQSRLIKYLRALSVRDRERFRQFVQSPYFNQHEPTIQLLEIILDALKEEKELKRKVVFRELYPDKKYREQTIHNLMSSLMKLYQRFLAHEHLSNAPFLEELSMLEEAYDINQFDLLTNRTQQLDKQLDKYEHRDAQYHYAQYRLNQLEGYYVAGYIDRSNSKQLQKMLDHFDCYYTAVKLRNCCRLTANMMVINTQYNFHFLEPLLQHIRDNWDFFGKEPSIELYYTILQSLQEEDQPERYAHLKEMMASKIDQLSPVEGKDLYEFSYNYCIRQINSGRSQYQWELFDLYKQGLQNGLLLYENNFLSEWDYKNIVTLGCKLKEFEWTERFIENYKDRLPAHRQENAYKYNLANLYYNKKMYEETLSTLHQVQFTDVKYHLNYNFLLLRTYYAMQDTEALLSLLETFRIYVIRNRKMTAEQKRGYTNFIRYAKKLVLLRHQASTYSKKTLQEKLSALAEKIRNTEHVINSYWLLEECQLEPAREGQTI